MANLGHRLSDQTAGQHSLLAWPLSCAPSASFIRAHREVLVGTDFFTVEVLTLKGLVSYHVLFFTHLESRPVSLGGMTPYPEVDGAASTKCDHGGVGIPETCRYLLHDRDTKFCASFRELIESENVKTILLPARSPNLNAFAERW